MRLIPVLLLLYVITAAGCNKVRDAHAPSNSVPAAETPTAATVASSAGDVPASKNGRMPAQAGTQLTLATGGQVEVLSVAKFDQQQTSLSGVIAIEGRVAECFPERGVFVLVDVENMAGCSDGCCPQAQVPVQLDLAQYQGELPQPNQQVVIIGELARTELGYNLTVGEIRRNGQTILARAV